MTVLLLDLPVTACESKVAAHLKGDLGLLTQVCECLPVSGSRSHASVLSQRCLQNDLQGKGTEGMMTQQDFNPRSAAFQGTEPSAAEPC